ncbi:ethanolamine ammonia-lyase subunit EutC [Ureibacillus sp. FSL K6-3587]|jgi:ethanolamine ammonia-lyase small subunit|uniref:ethanolamine ammonia-lyase subunit EutC n=1 Tax=Ureibacillus sp. FSL K6-3587 TaxID=2954681 RepID=UPI00315975EC
MSEVLLDTSFLEVVGTSKETPARIGVGRAGLRPLTKTWLKFRYDHAAAVDAVNSEVSKSFLDKRKWPILTTQALDQATYIRRPDLGRKLSKESREYLMEHGQKGATVQIIVSNGLSATAIEENAEDVYLSLCQSLELLNIPYAPTFYFERGRVGLMDEIGELLQPEVILYFIGERPGLLSAESMSVYMCYQPNATTIESDRLVVSNIHRNGLPPVEAGAYISTIVEKMLHYKASGVKLLEAEKKSK